MPSTYTPIATTALGSTASSYTFSSIPSTYTDLVLISNAATTVANKDLAIQFNSDTGSNYSRTVLFGDGSSAGSARATSQAQIFLDYWGWTTTTLGTQTNIAQIMNYANTTTNKTVLARSNTSSSGVDAVVGLWRSTAAINSITIIATTSGVFSTGSTFTLYGIKAA
jgi:hypothetical protein